MIKAMVHMQGTDRRGLLIGLSRENTRRMHEGEPILFQLAAMVDDAGGHPEYVVVVAGETEDEIRQELGHGLDGDPRER